MKKFIVFFMFLMVAGLSANAQEEQPESKEPKVKHMTYNDFKELIWNFEKNPYTFVYQGELPAIIDFYADWCGPCRRLAPIMEKLAEEYDGKLLIYKVNVDEEKQLSAAFQVRSIPMVLFFPMEGMPYKQVGAMQEQGYREVIEKYLVK